ncbi:MAG: hypothetical protein EA381_19670 [Planctomycetaceae bacterium]|nr:MAG: hypothetical protein EA381_19670 [Planctomycetaceae bacterium]
MPISGTAVHQQLIQAQHEATQDLELARGEIAEAGEELNHLSETRGDALSELARHYLPELSPEAVARTLPDIREWVRELLVRKQHHAERLVEDLHELERRRETLEATLAEVSAELDAADDRQQTITKEIGDLLAADPEFSTLSNRAAEAEATLQRSEANLAEIEQDAIKKLAAYENSALFMYLWNREFGTAAYGSHGLTRSMDDWLARYIDFRDARKGYEFLKTTPEHMRRLIAEDRQALGVVLDELERRRDVTATERGLPDAILRYQEIAQRRETVIGQLDQLEVQAQQWQAERTRVDDPRGTYYQEAVQKFRDLLSHSDPSLLIEQARATPAIEDDLIVARLQGLKTEIDQVSDQVRQRQQTVAELSRHLQAIGHLISRYRAAGFDSQRAQFNVYLDVPSEIRAIRDGNGDYEAFWQRIRKSQRWGQSVLDQATQVATHPMTQVLIHAMASAAAGALQEQARQAGQRRARTQSPTVLRPIRPIQPIRRPGVGGVPVARYRDE